MLSKSTKKIFNYGFGTILFIWLCYSLYIQLISRRDLLFSLRQMRQSVNQHWPVIAVVILLMFVNWGIEARKWQLLTAPFEVLSYRKAWYSVLTGISFSMITPNRVGAYGGRILFLKNENRLKGVSVTGIGSLSQFTTTMFFGLLGGIYFIFHFDPIIAEAGLLPEILFLILVAVLLIAALLLYFHLEKLTNLFGRIKWLRRFQHFVRIINVFSKGRLGHILWLSGGRYLVFSAQYLILLEIFGANVLWWQGYLMIFIVYLCLTLIPTIAIAELGIRGALSVWILGLVSSSEVAILAATLGIWLLNLLIPAVIGSILLPGIKILNEGDAERSRINRQR